MISDLGPQLFNVSVDQATLRERVLADIRRHLTQETGLSRIERDQITTEVADDILGHGPLERLLADDTVSEIMVNGPYDIWVERMGRLSQTSVRFQDDSHLRRILNKIVAQVGRRVDETSAMVDARLPDGSRINAIIPPLSLSGPLVTIRKFARERLTFQDLIRLGTMTTETIEFLERCVQAKLNILDLRRNRHREDDAPERPLGGDPRDRPHRHDRGLGRALGCTSATCCGSSPARRTSRARASLDPRPAPQLPAHAPRPDHRRRGPRRRGARHAPGDEHRP